MKHYEPIPGFSIPCAAMGCMRISEMPIKDLEKLVMTAVEGGMTYFDHADFYGNSLSETRFGEVMALHPELRGQIQVQSKCGISTKGYYDSSYEHIMTCAENSLKKLQVEYLDALLIHRPDVLAEPDEVARAFGELSASGKVRYFGVSNHNPMQIEVLQQAVGQRLVINQMQMSLMHTGMINHGVNVNTEFDGAVDKDGAALEYCKLHRMVVQAWSPFQYGFFEGVFVDNPKFPELNAKMDEMAKKYGVTKTALAVAWLVRIPAMVQVISGTTNVNRMREIITGANTVIERPDWYALYRAAGNNLP